MGYNFEMDGIFTFDKKLPSKVLKIFKQMNENYELEEDWYQKNLNNKNIVACWCPWCYNEEKNRLETIEDVYELNHNYYFIDWIAWIIESICIPNGLKLNGNGYWEDVGNFDLREEHFCEKNYLPNGDGKFEVNDNFIKVKGVFFGSGEWKKSIRRVNNLVKPKEKIEKKPEGEIKGSFCVTGKVSMSRNEFQKLGVKYGYEFKSSITKDLTYLICNDPNSTSSKIKNAKKNGIKVITEEEFNTILGI